MIGKQLAAENAYWVFQASDVSRSSYESTHNNIGAVGSTSLNGKVLWRAKHRLGRCTVANHLVKGGSNLDLASY